MKRIVADTSALISLSLSSQLDLIVMEMAIFCPEAVKDELLEVSEFPDEEGKAAKHVLRFIKKNAIQPVLIKNQARAGKLVDKNIDFGEAECFILAQENGFEIILMDDINAAYALSGLAKASNISIKISAAVIVELMKEKKLSKKQGIESLQKMIKNRQWEKSVLEYLIKKYID